MISKINYGNITEGSGIGVMAFKIQIDNQIFPEGQIGNVIGILLKHPNKRKVVEINGKFAPILNEQMLTLIMTLKDNGFHTQVNAPGDQYYPWFSLIDRLVIHVDDFKIWPTFKCEDFVYYVSVCENDIIPEPEVPKYPNVILYLNPYWNINKLKLLRFIENSPNKWRFYPRDKSLYEIKIYKYFEPKDEMEVINGTSN